MSDEKEQAEAQGQPDKPAKHPGGRPRILQSPEAAQALIDLYFQTNKDKPTMCGLALRLGFVDLQSLHDYINRDDEFSPVIKTALCRIEEFREANLWDEKCTGSIFWLKNRGWKDSHDFTSGGEKITPQVVTFAEVIKAAATLEVPAQ